MVFSFFARKPSVTVPTTTTTTTTPDAVQSEGVPDESDAQVTGMTSSSTPFVFAKEEQQQQQIPESSSSTPPVGLTGSPPPMPPPATPSPAPEPQVTDPKALHNLISSVPPQTLHEYCLGLLDPAAFDAVTGRANQTRKRRRKSGVVTAEETAEALKPIAPPLKPHPVLTPPTLDALTSFFRELVPPPQLHCVRCHKQYFELENSDYSCRVAHDDDSTIVERVGTKIVDSSEEEEDEDENDTKKKGKDGKRSQSPRRPRKSAIPTVKGSIYETLWGCCGQTVEGDGDQGPPDGWCYEGRHTTDLKRARFRADSTPQDDKLKSCHRMRCSRPPVSQASESTATPSVRSGALTKRKRNTRASIDYREAPDEDEDEAAERKRDEDFIVDDDAKSTGSGSKRRRKDPSAARGRGRGRGGAGTGGGGRKKAFKSKEEVDEKDDDDSMQVDEPQAGPSNAVVAPQSPPASPPPKPASPAAANPPSTAAKPKRPRGRPPGSTTKPAKPSPLGVQREDTLPADEVAPAGTPRGRSQVFVDVPGRQGSTSPTRGGNVLTRADIISLKAKGSVASLRDKFENSPSGQAEEKKVLRTRKKPLDLGDVVDSSVDNEVDML